MQSCLHLGNFCLKETLIKTNILHSVNVIMSGSLHVLWSDPRLSSHEGISWKIPYLPQGGNLGSIYVFFVVDKKITNGQLIFQDYFKLLISMVNFKTLKQMKTCFLNIYPLILGASRAVSYKRPKVNRLVPVWKFRRSKFFRAPALDQEQFERATRPPWKWVNFLLEKVAITIPEVFSSYHVVICIHNVLICLFLFLRKDTTAGYNTEIQNHWDSLKIY